ncbi:pyridoxamine 5'-phosphate oxidase family protein [Haloarcula litorea]|uniref:pyridoxamine 5'-phosphate oxidase family protein n=1 Tax=Haloarcula litorea TaxID=3032579 RepID=UPI0023E8A63B|nr:pyridoxamine 5'-phosphate oxidase family protein [Halomicroarcula sp. GDY20]
MTVDALAEFGLDRLSDDEVRDFLATQRMGVLGLDADDVPYLVPLSFGYDGDRTLYFTFVGGPESRKRTLIETARRARFLTYAAQSPFNWESVLLTGTVDEVPESDWDDLAAVFETAWRPAVVKEAGAAGDVSVVRFDVDEWTGIKHTGLPPGLDAE